MPESHQMQLEGDKELYVGGVHVHIFLKDPHFPLRNPKVGMHDQHGHITLVPVEHCMAHFLGLQSSASRLLQIQQTHTQYVSADTHAVRVRQAVTCYLTAAPVARMEGATNHAQMPRFLFQYAHVPTLQYLLAVQRFCLYAAHFVDTILAAAAAAAAAVHYLYSGHMCSLHRPSHFPSINLLRPNISCSCFISSMS